MTGTVVCWDCVKGRHAICPDVITADFDSADIGKKCQCPVCHANRYADRSPVWDPAAERYVDPTPGGLRLVVVVETGAGGEMVGSNALDFGDPATWDVERFPGFSPSLGAPPDPGEPTGRMFRQMAVSAPAWHRPLTQIRIMILAEKDPES